MNYKEIVLAALCKLGFEPAETESGNYKFNYHEATLAYFPEEDDEQFLRIAIPYVVEITPSNEEYVKKAITDTENSIKYIRVNTVEDIYVWLQYDHYLSLSECTDKDKLVEELEDVIGHIVRVLYFSLREFTDMLPESVKQEDTLLSRLESISDEKCEIEDETYLEEELKALLAKLNEMNETEDMEYEECAEKEEGIDGEDGDVIEPDDLINDK